MKLWLKLGIATGLVVSLLSLSVVLIADSIYPLVTFPRWAILFSYIVTYPAWFIILRLGIAHFCMDVLCPPDNPLYTSIVLFLITFAVWFIVGAFVGWVIEKIKNIKNLS